MKQGQSIRDAGHLYETERRVFHAARPGLSSFEDAALADPEGAVAQAHTNNSDTFYVSGRTHEAVLAGSRKRLKPSDSARPHPVTNGGTNWPRDDRVIGQNKLTAGGSLT